MPTPPHFNKSINTHSSSSSPSSPYYYYKVLKPRNIYKLLLLIVSMATSLLLFYTLLFFSLSSVSTPLRHPRPHFDSQGAAAGSALPTAAFQQACRGTRYPDACQTMLAQSGRTGSGPVDIIESALAVSEQNLKMGQAMVKGILDGSARDQNRSRAAQTCLEVLSMSQYRASAAADALSRGKVRDARAWASAALCYQYDCWSGLKYVNNSAAVNATMSYFDTTLIVSTSNALSMMQALDALGPNIASWAPPLTERDGFWAPVVAGNETGFAGFGPMAGIPADATVCKDGGSCFKTVQEAVDAAPENLAGRVKYMIRIKEGVYEETVRVGFNKRNLVFLGDGIGKTVITGSLNTGIQGITTYNTATVGVLGDGFMAINLTIENTAGPDAHQAVAFRSDSDFSYIENCEFLGNQDTIYVHSLRQLFKSCHIEGNVDFIFGNAAAIFHDCTILVRPRQANPEKGETNAIAAHGRTDPAQTTGFAFLGCLINGTDEYMRLYYSKPSKHKNYLGRPWKSYSRTVYINNTIEALVSPDGWLPWSGDFALSTLYYGEFGNSGQGADLSKRVPWSTQIPAAHISTYYVQNFLQGDEWL